MLIVRAFSRTRVTEKVCARIHMQVKLMNDKKSLRKCINRNATFKSEHNEVGFRLPTFLEMSLHMHTGDQSPCRSFITSRLYVKTSGVAT